MSQPASPCNGICQVDKSSGWCVGCFRSLAEIAGWSTASAAEKRAVLAQLAKRKPA